MNKIRLSVFIMSFIIFFGNAKAETSNALVAPPLNFFVGRYQVIGKDVSSGAYSGAITMIEEQGRLKVQRHIGKEIIHGEATIIRVIENIPALRIEFTDSAKKLTATYQINTDWNNYARLTGYLETQDTPNKSSGIEALFYNEDVMESEIPDTSSIARVACNQM